MPDAFRLGANYPNPFRSATEIRFDLPKDADVRLTVYDVLGREVAQLVDDRMPAGYHRVRFNATQLPSGVYVYRLTAGSGFTETKRMVLVK